MNKKLLGVLLAAIIAVVGVAVWMDTWTSCTISMTASTASIITIGQYKDCDTQIAFTSHDWNGVVQGQTYEVTVYVKNTGTEAVYITYLPTDLTFDSDQTRMTITCYQIEGPATPCQLNPIDPWVLIDEKIATNCLLGVLLHPGKVIKVDIQLYVISVVSGGNWAWNFVFHGCAP